MKVVEQMGRLWEHAAAETYAAWVGVMMSCVLVAASALGGIVLVSVAEEADRGFVAMAACIPVVVMLAALGDAVRVYVSRRISEAEARGRVRGAAWQAWDAIQVQADVRILTAARYARPVVDARRWMP